MAPPPRVAHDDLRRDQAQAHTAYVPLAVAGMAIVIAFLGASLWPVIPHHLLELWLASLALPFALRLALAFAYQRQPERWAATTWLRGFRATFALHGLAWATGAVLLFGSMDLPDRALLGFVVAGVIASALNIAAFDLVAGMLVLWIAVAPWSLRMLAEGGRVPVTIGAMLALFLVYMTMNGIRIHRRYLDSVALRRAAAARAEALATFQAAFGRLWQVEHGDPAELLSAITREVAAALHLDQARLFRFDPATDTATCIAAAGPAAGSVTPDTLRLSAVPAYLAALAGAGRLSSDGTKAADWADTAGTALAPTPGAARLDVPLGGAARLAGVLCCERPSGAWSHDEAAFVTAAAATLQAAAEESHRREAERQLRDLNQNLEQLVEARTSALRESESRLALTLDATNDGVWDFDLETGAVYFSPVWARLLGYAPDEVAPSVDTFWNAVHPDDAARVQSTLDRHIRGELPHKELEVRMRMKTGEYRWFLDQGKVVDRAPDGRARRMLGTITDITARKQALEDLHESELRFRALFDKSPIIVTLVDGTGRMTELNEVAIQALGYSREDAIGHTTLDLGVWVDPAARDHYVERLRAHGVVSGLEVELRRKDGRRFWGLLSAARVSMHGEPYVLSTVLDITERRQLESRVLQSQKMEVVGHLAGGVAHDFNNVLTVITSTAELALSGTRDGDPMFEALQTIRAASTRAARLTGQLLAFSRRQILQPAAMDLNEVVAGVTPMIRRVVGDAIVLDVRSGSAPVTVMADRGSVEQVILNLAINARDAMPDGGTLTLAVDGAAIEAGGAEGTSLAAGSYARLTVSDTGTGMTEATRQRIFEPFFTTKDVGKGTGLGLSMAHGVVQQSGGDIVVRSTLGLGSSFTIYLPLSAAAPERPAPATRQVTSGSETVLVVDDDQDIRAVLRRALTFAGYDVLLAANGEEALTLLQARQGRVDLVLTDVMMPGIGGRELAERVRAGHPSARILFTSGYAENAIAHHGVLADGVQFLAKPYSLQALTQKVREVLDR